MTTADALAWLNGGWKSSPYAKTENGKLGIDVDNLYGFQCMDFSAAYSRFLGAPFTSGNAIVLAQAQNGWTRETTPAPGDVFVADYFSGGINYGHTGCVVSVSGSNFNSIDQNWFNSSLTVGSPPAQITHPISFAKSFLRNNNLQGDVAMPSSKEVVSAFNQYGVPGPTADQVTYYSTRPWDTLINDLLTYVGVNETLNAAAITDAFQLAGKTATAADIAYWTKQSPEVFLAALLGSRATPAIDKQAVLTYLNAHLS